MLNRVSSKLCGHVRCIYDWVNIVIHHSYHTPLKYEHISINCGHQCLQMSTINIDSYQHFKICIGSVCAHCHRIKSIKKNVVLNVVSQI